MARATATVPPHYRVTHPDPNRALRRWLAGELGRLQAVQARYCAAVAQADRYRKHFTTWGHTCLLLFHGLSQSASLRQSYAGFAASPELLAWSGLAAPLPPDAAPDSVPSLQVSFSQLAASNTRRRPGFLAALVPALQAQLGHDPPPGWALPGGVLLDSTFLALSCKLAPWLPARRTKRNQGLRLQVQYDPADDVPVHVLLHDTRLNDCTGGLDASILDDPARLAQLRDQTLIIDLGYYSHARFAALLAAGVHVLTRTHPQATVTVVVRQEVQTALWAGASGRITVLADERVDVGSAANRQGTVLHGLRRVTATVAPQPAAARQGKEAQTYTLLTDRWDLTALEVVQAYVWRWQIELFFRWLKSHLHLPHLLGHSRHAVVLSVWLVLVVHLLTVLAARALGRVRRSPALLRLLGQLFQHLTAADRQRQPPPQQASFAACNAAAWFPP